MQRLSSVLYLVTSMALVVLTATSIGCSSPAECEVRYEAASDLPLVVLNPPGETGRSYLKAAGDIKRSIRGSREEGGPLIQVIDYDAVSFKRTFEESGNTYSITGEIHMSKQNEDVEITRYNLKVTGGVYGDSPRHFIKE